MSASPVDVIITWPTNCDYPIWRSFYYKNRDLFNNIFIVRMETNDNNVYFDNALENDLKNHGMTVLQSERILSPLGFYDWRHSAVSTALKLVKKTNSSHVFFTEQDFIPSSRSHIEVIIDSIIEVDYAYIKQGDRHHPACLFASKQALSIVNIDFAALPGKYDHFYQFTTSCNKLMIKKRYLPDGWYEHMNGLSHNWSLVLNGCPPVYKKDDFFAYLKLCIKVYESGTYVGQNFIDKALFVLKTLDV